jgi:tRNA A-37 threonylcarbamoyl transferase component Bud32
MARTLGELLFEWERRQNEGSPVTPEALCADRPQDLADLLRRIERLETCDQLLGLSTPDSTSDEELPKRIGDYEIRGWLGRGGMGVVYRGWDPGLKRAVAVKVIRPSVIDQSLKKSSELTVRFEREREVLGRLEHEHIVPVYSSGLSDGRPYVAMAFMAGGSLRDRFRDLSRQGPRAAAAFIEKVARGVHTAHQLGVLHRDLKPANILLDAKGEPRVSDFGLAKFWSPDEWSEDSCIGVAEFDDPRAGELTGTGVQPGTPAYMAPEQFEPGFGRIGPATDVWAIGVILFELVSGSRPFAAEDDSPLWRQVCNAPAPRCRSPHYRVPRWLQEIIARCLAKKPADRYPSAATLAAALQTGLRRTRRRAWALGSVAVLALVLLVGLGGGQWLLPDLIGDWNQSVVSHSRVENPGLAFAKSAEVRKAIADLEQKKDVVLIDETHRAPYWWVLGKETGRGVESQPGWLTLHSKWASPAAAEFLPRLPPGKYRIRALIQHDEGNNFSKVGLYVGGYYWESAEGRHLHCIALHYQDVGHEANEPPRPGKETNSIAPFGTVLTGEIRTRSSHWDNVSQAGAVDFNSAAAANRRPAGFRVVEFEVSGSGVEGWFDGHRAGFQSLHDTNETLQRLRRGYADLNPENPPMWGGLGFLVFNGTLSVREFRITPIE